MSRDNKEIDESVCLDEGVCFDVDHTDFYKGCEDCDGELCENCLIKHGLI